MADPLASRQPKDYAQNKEKDKEPLKVGTGLSSVVLQIETPEIQSFVRTMLEKSIFSLKPVMSFERGATYPEVSQFFRGKKSESEIQSFLLELTSLGLLDKKIVDRIITCPSCKGTRVYSKYQCAKCGSFDVSAMQIIEHLLCGYIGPRSSLIDGVICPQCKQKIMSEKDYRSLGKTFGCLNCQYRFETPPIVHRCEDCASVFSYNQATYSPVYEFSISPKTREDFTSGLLSLKPVIRWLRDQGYQVDSPKEVLGTSGSKHRFDIVAHTGALKNVLLGDFAFTPSDQVIIATFAKKYDVNPNAKSFVVTYTLAPESINSVARIYDISIIYIGEVKTPLEDQLKRMLSGTPQTIAASKVIPPSDFYLGDRTDDAGRLGRKINGKKVKEEEDEVVGKVKADKPKQAIITKKLGARSSPEKEKVAQSQILLAEGRQRRRLKMDRKRALEENDEYYLVNDSDPLDRGKYEENDFLLNE